MKTDMRINVMYCVRLVHVASFWLSSFEGISRPPDRCLGLLFFRSLAAMRVLLLGHCIALIGRDVFCLVFRSETRFLYPASRWQ